MSMLFTVYYSQHHQYFFYSNWLDFRSAKGKHYYGSSIYYNKKI